jgi:hypothetical protein
MTSPFWSTLNRIEHKFDALMGEVVRITPQASGDFGAAADPDRPPFEVVALVHEVDPSSADAGQMLARLPYEEWELEIHRPALAGRAIRKGDDVQLIRRPGAPRFSVSRPDDVDANRIRLTLARKAAT